MKIPITIDEFFSAMKNFNSEGRIVSDELLLARFAFYGQVRLTMEETNYLMACAILGEQYAVKAGVAGQKDWEKFHTMEVILRKQSRRKFI